MTEIAPSRSVADVARIAELEAALANAERLIATQDKTIGRCAVEHGDEAATRTARRYGSAVADRFLGGDSVDSLMADYERPRGEIEDLVRTYVKQEAELGSAATTREKAAVVRELRDAAQGERALARCDDGMRLAHLYASNILTEKADGIESDIAVGE